jgi:hypothetical protein
MTARKRREPESQGSRRTIGADADFWVRQFVKQFELHILEASHHLPPEANVVEFQMATARATLATFLESGMELESAMEMFGQASLEAASADVGWSDALNQRRFALIDKDIQASLTPAETVELAGLTRIMRPHVDSEQNLPMDGARALHRKLLQLESPGKSD